MKIAKNLGLPSDWFKIIEANKATIFKITSNTGPGITYAVELNNNLQLQTFVYGHAISVAVNNLKTTFTSNNVTEITDVVDLLNGMNVASDTDVTVKKLILKCIRN